MKPYFKKCAISAALSATLGLYLGFASPIAIQKAAAQASAVLDPVDSAQAFNLHSRPRANRVIYLDFNGTDGSNLPADSYFRDIGYTPLIASSLDADLNTFSEQEKQYIIKVWKLVAEDFAPFNVDVTTAFPGFDALFKTSDLDNQFGNWVMISSRLESLEAFGGSRFGISAQEPSIAFGVLSSLITPQAGANLISRHISQMLGAPSLNSNIYGTGRYSWTAANGFGGVAFGVNSVALTQWSKVIDASGAIISDPLNVISSQIGYVPDQYPENPDLNAPMSVVPDPSNATRSTVDAYSAIETTGDVDSFVIKAGVGNVSLNVRTLELEPTLPADDPNRYGTNLDAKLTVKDALGNIVASSDNLGAASENVSFDNTENNKTFIVSVTGVGKDPNNAADPRPYDNYGSLGFYALEGSYAIPLQYTFNSFFKPIANLPAMNKVKAGFPIPIRFSLGGDFGLGVFADGYPKVASINCNAPPTQPLTTGDSAVSKLGLMYNSLSGKYIYQWKTDKSWGGSCKQLIVKLNDGQVKAANFKFKKTEFKEREHDRDDDRDRDWDNYRDYRDD